MKNLLSIICIVLSVHATAQVKFNLQGSKDKNSNIVYIGIPNQFKISTPQEISVTKITPSQGIIRMNSDGSFSLYIQELTDDPIELKYLQTKNGVESEITYATHFTVKRVPDIYQLKIGNITKGGKISLKQIQKNYAVSFNDAGFDKEIKNMKIKFALLHSTQGKDPVALNYSSDAPEIIKQYNTIMKTLKAGDKLYFEQVQMTDDSGVTRNAETMNILLTE
jgi:hypothetical protein